MSVTGSLSPGFFGVPVSGTSCVSADAVSSELSPGVDCCVFHRKADNWYQVIELISSTLATCHQNINTLNVLKECSFCCLALDMPQLGKFNLLEGCLVTAEWDRPLSYYWSFCHSGFMFWHSWCEVCLPQSSPRSVFQGRWRCIGDLLAPCKFWPSVLEMFMLMVSDTTTSPTSCW